MWCNIARQGPARLGLAWPGEVRPGKAGQGYLIFIVLGMVGLGMAR